MFSVIRSTTEGGLGVVLLSTFGIYLALGGELDSASVFATIGLLISAHSTIAFISGRGLFSLFMILATNIRIS